MRPPIKRVQRRLDLEEPPVKTPAPPASSPQKKENVEEVVERVLRRLIPAFLQQLGGTNANVVHKGPSPSPPSRL
jgi:hypothetical protein